LPRLKNSKNDYNNLQKINDADTNNVGIGWKLRKSGD
jgi:hypothetical protein